MQPKVHIQPGTLPPFWNRRVVFFANLLSLFYGNEGETQELVREVGGLATYGGRLVPILDTLFAGGENLLVLEQAPQSDLMAYFEETLAIPVPAWTVLPESDYPLLHAHAPEPASRERQAAVAAITGHAAEWIDGFVTDRTLVELSGALDKLSITTREGSLRGNNKYFLHQHLVEAGLPAFDTEEAADQEAIAPALRALRQKGYPRAVIKAPVGASGIGMMKVDTHFGEAGERVPEHLFFEGPVLVQGWLGTELPGVERVYSPSVQVFVGDQDTYLYDTTEQVLTADSVHEGNLSPPPYFGEAPEVRAAMLDQAADLSRWLHQQGYRGTASVDFVIVQRRDGYTVYVCEVNARVTGATYPSVLARRILPHGAWLMRNVRFIDGFSGRELLDILSRQEELVTANQPAGVLPINFNQQPDGDVQKGQFLCLGETVGECIQALERMELLLPVDWEYDRD